MDNYDQLINMAGATGAKLPSTFRSPTPSILTKRTIRQNPMDLSQLIPQDPQMQLPGGGLGSLQTFGRSLMGNMYPKQDQNNSGQMSLLGGL